MIGLTGSSELTHLYTLEIFSLEELLDWLSFSETSSSLLLLSSEDETRSLLSASKFSWSELVGDVSSRSL